jgi:16S rRNA (guanine527-N7)-methyltransferase
VKRLEELGRRYGVASAGLHALEAILALQAEDPAASTTVIEPSEAVDRHVADSLVAVDLPAVRHAGRIADLGSGAGWPGLALAAALSDARVALVESAIRHCRYLERAVAAGRLENALVIHARAEEWGDGIGAHDVVTARALAALPVLCEYAAPLLVDGGVLVAWKGAVDEDEASAGAAAAALLGLEPAEVLAVDPYPAAERRTLHVYRKVAPTPERFPRRAGMAVKRPLGSGGRRS